MLNDSEAGSKTDARYTRALAIRGHRVPVTEIVTRLLPVAEIVAEPLRGGNVMSNAMDPE